MLAIESNNINRATAIQTGKAYFDNIALLRIVLIFLLVWTHAFAPWHGWGEIEGILASKNYFHWIGKITYYIFMPGLLMISGFLLGSSAKRKPERLNAHGLIVKKIKRFLIPSIIFSFVYYLMFYDLSASPVIILNSILNGCGHLWFLPMLFWCFVITWFVSKLGIKHQIILIFAILTAIIPPPLGGLSFRLNNALHYYIYFYMGFSIQTGMLSFLEKAGTVKNIFIAIAIYLTTFTLYNTGFFDSVINIAGTSNNEIQKVAVLGAKILNLSIANIAVLVMSVAGLLTAFWIVNLIVGKGYSLSGWLVQLSTYCYGVYILQQFLLMFIYYHSSLPQTVSIDILPYIAILITLAGCLVMVHFFLKTRAGRFLIG